MFEEAMGLSNDDDWIRLARMTRKMAWCFENQHTTAAMQVLKLHEQANVFLEHSVTRSQKWWEEWLEIQLDHCWSLYWQGYDHQFKEVLDSMREPVSRYALQDQKIRYEHNINYLEFKVTDYHLGESTIALAESAYSTSRETGNVKTIANAVFHLSFTNLWANQVEESIRITELNKADTEKTGDKFLITRIHVYYFVACRRAGKLDKTESLINEFLLSDKYVKIPEYIGMAKANLVWVYYKNGMVDEMHSAYKECMQYWKPGETYFPFFFTFAAPMLAHYFSNGEMDKGITFLQILLLPRQRRLEKELCEKALSIIQHLENDNILPTENEAAEIILLLKRFQYL
jgi:hypothetical protein